MVALLPSSSRGRLREATSADICLGHVRHETLSAVDLVCCWSRPPWASCTVDLVCLGPHPPWALAVDGVRGKRRRPGKIAVVLPLP